MKRVKNFVTVSKKSAKVKILFASKESLKVESIETVIDDVNEKTLAKVARNLVPEGSFFMEASIVETIETKLGIPYDVFLTFATPIVTVNENEVQDLSDEVNKYIQPRLKMICNDLTRAKNRIKEIGLEDYEAEKEAKRNANANTNN